MMTRKAEILDIIDLGHAIRVEYRFTFSDGSTEEGDATFSDHPEPEEIKKHLKFIFKQREKARSKPKPDYSQLLKNKKGIVVE